MQGPLGLIAGGLLCVGLGGGLILGRTLPMTSSPTIAAAAAETVESAASSPRAIPSGYSSLFDPQDLTFPLPARELQDRSEPVDTPTSAPRAPRLLPQGDASPVAPPAEASHEVEPPATGPSPGALNGFRDQLEQIAPEFPEAALDELEKIRRVIELGPPRLTPEPSEDPVPSARPADPPETSDNPADPES